MTRFFEHDTYGFKNNEIEIYHPARGVERRTMTDSKDPYSPLANRSLSQPAKWLREAMRGNESAENALKTFLGVQIEGTAKVANWGLKGNIKGLAAIAIHPYIYRCYMTQQDSADKCGISRRTYARSWEKSLGDKWMKKAVKNIHAELRG